MASYWAPLPKGVALRATISRQKVPWLLDRAIAAPGPTQMNAAQQRARTGTTATATAPAALTVWRSGRPLAVLVSLGSALPLGAPPTIAALPVKRVVYMRRQVVAPRKQTATNATWAASVRLVERVRVAKAAR